MSDMEVDEIAMALLRRGLVDWVPLHDVVWFATKGSREPAAKARVLRALERVFDRQLMVPGDLAHAGFQDWPSPESWLSRAAEQLDRLEWAPMGDGLWLRLSKRGQEALEEWN